jgi:tetratricopeptide (TPR) repeat protein
MRSRTWTLAAGILAAAAVLGATGSACSAGSELPSRAPSVDTSSEVDTASVVDTAPVVAATGGGTDPALTAAPGQGGPVDERIETLERRIEPDDGDHAARSELAALYLERARRTGDLAGYERAEALAGEALDISPGEPAAQAVLASVRYGRHEFAEAAAIAEGVLARSPSERQAIAVLGDARLELGDLAGAEAQYDRLRDLAGPVPEVLVRLARLAWLSGDVGAALEQADRALTTSFLQGADGPTTAYYEAQLATYRFEAGEVEAAITLAEKAVGNAPGWPGAHGVLGRSLAAAGRIDDAIAAYEAAVAIVPSPRLVAALGDLYALAGRPEQAEEQYDTVLLIAELASQDGAVVYDRDLARFLADHEREVDRAVELARAELAVRPDAYGYDTLAWALYASGDIGGAIEAIEPALEAGLADAQVLYHAGMIHAAAANDAEAASLLDRALAINPDFDPLQAPVAADTLATIEEAS